MSGVERHTHTTMVTTANDVKPMFGKAKTKITLEREGKITTILGRAITDLSTSKVQNRLRSGKYILLEIKEKTYLVKVDRIRKSLYTSEASISEGQGLAPTKTVTVIREMMKTAAPHRAASDKPAIDTGEDLLTRLEHEANLAKTGMTPEEAKAIMQFATNLKNGKAKTKDGKPISRPPPAIYIKKDSVKPPLKCSLNVLSNGEVCVLLKSKVGILEAFKMKFKGGFKTVKTALNVHTGELLAHSILDITKEANKRYDELCRNKDSSFYRARCGFGPDGGNPLQPTFSEQDKAIIKEQVIKEIKQECAHQTQFSPRIAIKEEDIVIYTDKNGNTKASFPCTKAAGDLRYLANDERLTNMLNNPKELKGNLVGLAQSMAMIHKEDLVYRDAKPGNILLIEEKNSNGSPILVTKKCAKVTLVRADYGQAATIEEAATSTAGTPITAAPNTSFNIRSKDPKKADMWSEAASMLLVLTGSTTNFNTQLAKAYDKGEKLDSKYGEHLIQNAMGDAKQKMLNSGYSEMLANLYSNQFNPDRQKCLDADEFLAAISALEPKDFARTNRAGSA